MGLLNEVTAEMANDIDFKAMADKEGVLTAAHEYVAVNGDADASTLMSVFDISKEEAAAAVEFLEDAGLHESTNSIKDAESQLATAPVGATANGGGYGPWEKQNNKSWMHKKIKRPFSDVELAKFLSGFRDFEVEHSGMNEMNVTGNLDGGLGQPKTPFWGGDIEANKIEKNGSKKTKKGTKNSVKENKGSSYSQIMKEMYDVTPIREAQKYDIEAAVRRIREFNRGNYSHFEDPTAELSAEIIKDLGAKVDKRNIQAVEDHLMASTNHNGIPEDRDVVKELYPMLEAVSYREYKKDPNTTPSRKVNNGIQEVNKMLAEIEKIVTNNLKLKLEMGVESASYWKTTGNRFAKINERMTRLSNKLKELSQ